MMTLEMGSTSRVAMSLVGALTVLVVSACGTNTYSTTGAKSNVELLSRVNRNPGLSSDIIIEGARIDDKAGNAIAQVTLRNTGQTERVVEYRFDWLDANGSRVSPSSTPWREITLGAGEVQDLKSAGGADGYDFRFALRAK
jgi:uncharacterized protein YcfL